MSRPISLCETGRAPPRLSMRTRSTVTTGRRYSAYARSIQPGTETIARDTARTCGSGPMCLRCPSWPSSSQSWSRCLSWARHGTSGGGTRRKRCVGITVPAGCFYHARCEYCRACLASPLTSHHLSHRYVDDCRPWSDTWPSDWPAS